MNNPLIERLSTAQYRHNQISEETEQILLALEGAFQGVASAVEQDAITPQQIDCLLSLLLAQLRDSLQR